MLVIANNITTRNVKVSREFQQLKSQSLKSVSSPAFVIQDIARQCTMVGADMLEIDIQQHHDRAEVMELAINAVQQVTDCQLCLSTNNFDAVEAGLRACKRPPLVNFVSISGPKLSEMLPLIAKHKAGVILLVSDPTMPGDAQEMLKKAAIMTDAANEMGIPNESILIDPGLFHVTSEMGQHHLVEVMELLRALPDAFDPPVRSTCWVSNVSAGAPEKVRPAIDGALLAMLCGLGLSSVFLDVLKRENTRMVRLVKIIKNEAIYSDNDVEL